MFSDPNRLGQEMIAAYVEEIRGILGVGLSDCRGLREEGIDSSESRRLEKLFHRLAGSGGTYGFEEMSRVARELYEAFRLREGSAEALAERAERAIRLFYSFLGDER